MQAPGVGADVVSRAALRLPGIDRLSADTFEEAAQLS